MVNPGMDDCNKSLNQRKILRKKQKDVNLLKSNIKRIQKPKYMLSGGLVFTFSWPGESNLSFSLPSGTSLQQTLFKQNNQCLKPLLQLINTKASNLLSVKRHLSGLNIRPATLKICY